ncbi:Uncharacterised protein [Mycobacteroides abscessus subsp. abscessus]|nr:Uncharacterised protein [Mycobacteroides abscessus subsp. abscessus]
MKYPHWLPNSAASAAQGARTWMATGELGCAAISPAENNKVSPGRNGNSSPVSIKTMTMTPARTAPPNRPPSPSQYIGSMTSAGTRPMSMAGS